MSARILLSLWLVVGVIPTVDIAAPLTVAANVTDIRPRAAVELGRLVKSLVLPDLAIRPPLFGPMAQFDAPARFLEAADAAGLPAVLHNFYELAGKRADLPTIAAFADRAPMCAIKQRGWEFACHRELIALGREQKSVVMSGDDTRLTKVFARDSAGCTEGLVNIVHELMADIYRCSTAGLPGDSALSAARMIELGRVIDQLAFPPNVGAGLAARGFAPGASKSILSPASRALAVKIETELRALFLQWGLALGPVSAVA